MVFIRNIVKLGVSEITYRGAVPRRQGVEGSPRDLVGDDWPRGAAEVGTPQWYAQEIAAKLEAAVDGASLREIAEKVGLDHTTIRAVLLGERWADLVTLAKLEAGLGVRLWPDA